MKRSLRKKWVKRAGIVVSAAMLAVVILWLLLPAPIDPESWDPPDAPEEAGVFGENTLLRDAELLADG